MKMVRSLCVVLLMSLAIASVASSAHIDAMPSVLNQDEGRGPGIAGAGPKMVQPEVSPLPEGVSSEEWAGIQAGIRQAEYHLTWHESGAAFKAPNRAHGWSVAFTATGVEVTSRIPSPSRREPVLSTAEGGQGGGWSWGLSLTRYGYRGQLQTIASRPAQTVDANRVEYRHAEGQLVEWYVNDERGLEQGFTLQSPPLPRSPAPLHIEMALTGDLSPRLTDDYQAILFADEDDQTILRYDRLHVTDAAGHQLPAHLEISDSLDNLQSVMAIVIDDTDAVYPLTVDPLLTSEVAKLTASDGVPSDFFGSLVSISGDTVVVGAEGDDNWKGSAYVFERNQGGTADNWGQVKKLTSSDGATDDEFGISVAISGHSIVVGAYGDDSSKGSAYVFERNYDPTNPGTPSADNWGQVRKLTASDGVGGDYFGWCVAISGGTIVAGAYRDNIVPFLDQGSAYVFERNQGGADNWGQVKKLTASDGLGWDYFGTFVAIGGDTVVIGANGDDGSRGSTYVFERNYDPANPDTPSADNWGQVKKLTANDRAADDEFGVSVAISGHAILVGASGDDSDTGSAYVFRQAACLDLNSDDVVNTVDIMGVVARWGMTSTDPGWDSLYDLDGDLNIGVVDVMLVAGCWRQHC